MNKIYIIVLNDDYLERIMFIESVWTSEELARSAIIFHSYQSNIHISKYTIVERIVNVTYYE